MKKLIFLLLVLVGAVCASAQPGNPAGSFELITVTGLVTDITNGDPVPDHEVYATSNDSLAPAFGVGVTDPLGQYVITLEVMPGTTSITVFTFDWCTQEIHQQTNVPVVNSAASADFEIPVCAFNDCFADAYFQPTTNPNEIQFWGYGYSMSGDSLPFTYSWDFGDGTTGSGESPVHTYAQTGVYTVTMTATSPECSSTVTITVIVQAYDLVTVSGTVTDPNGSFVPFWQVQVGDYPLDQYVTTDANGFYMVQANVPQGSTSVNVYSFTFCDSFFGMGDLVVAPIVNSAAVANFTLCDVVPPIDPCSAYITYYQSNPADPLTYNFEYYAFALDTSTVVSVTWDFGDGTTSNEESPEHTYAQSGIYTVLLTTETSTGCVAHACDVVFAFDDSTYCPIDTFWYGCQAMFWSSASFNPAGGIDPLTLDFGDISFGAVLTRLWDFGDGTTSTDGPVVNHTYAQAGLYNVTLTITTVDGCESSISMLVYAGDDPWVEHECQALFIPFPDSTGNGFFFFDMSLANGPIQSWAWDFGDNTTSSEQNPYHEYAAPGIYTVTLTITADSCSSVISFELDTDNPFFRFEGGGVQGQAAGVSATQEPTTLSAARIAPNPVTDRINLAFESKTAQDVQVSVMNATGKVVRTATTSAVTGWNALQIPASDLSAGFYYVQIQGGKSMQTVKLVKAER